jgi:exosortase/archaeosortase family protein
MGLMLAFGTVLLLLFRHEYIFPRALLLIPAGLLLSFALNIARIAGLVLIGNAGYPEAAVYGFQGWLDHLQRGGGWHSSRKYAQPLVQPRRGGA